MPKILPHKENHLRRIIRDAQAIDPLISMSSLHSIVEKKINRSIDIKYIYTLVKKVQGELRKEVEMSTVHSRIREIRESNRIIIDELKRIAYPSPTEIGRIAVSERRKALAEISKIEDRQAKLEMDFGIFERHLGTIDVDHRVKPMDDDTRSKVVEAFSAWHTKPEMRKIEPRRTITVQSTIITNEPTKQQPSTNPAPVKPAPAPKPIPIVTNAGLVATE